MNGQGEFQERARKILIEAGFEPDFSSAIEEELQGISCPITFPEGVRDLRHLPWSSIDNSDSRDLDQVEYVERG
ncbi:MAG: RNB domain-containing ribonuclease, partial [Verrucomicrobiota bacterium]